jgi:Skp family chaperone for outer membrane proteins/polyhydroxyalkanoate synthesis regulator phasin
MNEFYTNWMESQSSMMKNWMESFQPAVLTNGAAKSQKENPANPYAAMLESQMSFMKQWMDNTLHAAEQARELMSGKSSNDGSAVVNFYQNWMSTQNDAMKHWMDASRKNQTFFNDYMAAGASTTTAMNNIFKLYDSWRNLASSWTTGSMSANMPFGKASDMQKMMQDMFKPMFTSPNAYTKMMEFWMPFVRAMQEYPTDVEKLRELASPEKYKELLDRMFEFSSPNAMNQYVEQMQEFAQTFNASTQDATKRLAGMMEKNAQALAEMMMGNPDNAMKLYNSMMSNYRKTFDMMQEFTGSRRDTEATRLATELMKRSGDYMTKLTQYQYSLYTTGQKAMEKVVDTITETAQNPANYESYDAFFKAWVETNEETYNHLFKSKEFVALQKELASVTNDVRDTFQSIMELFLQDYPVVLRSEVEELQKTVTDLQKKFHDLASADDEPKAAKPSTKATAKR